MGVLESGPPADPSHRRPAWPLLVSCAIAVGTGVFFSLTLRPGHDWGDDFAHYIGHARNLVEGRPYRDTGYLFHPRVNNPDTYPPVFPLLLAPVYMLRGLDLTSLK